MELGAKIAEGGSADIYEWGEGKILKLAKSKTSHYAMKREFDNHNMVRNLQLPTVQVYEMLSVDGRTGIVFEKFAGVTLLELLMQDLTAAELNRRKIKDHIQLFAQILHRIHQITKVNMPFTQRESLEYSINQVEMITNEEKDHICQLLNTFPEKQCLCHGDLNPGNVMIGNDGHYVIIDWMDASLGNPEGDLAEFIVMMRRAVLPQDVPKRAVEVFDSMREEIITIFMEEYTKLSGIAYEDVAPWLLPITARKLFATGIPEAEKQLLVQDVRKMLSEVQNRA